MKHILLLALVSLFYHCQGQKPAIKDGDIIFQSSSSPQCKAIKLATHSDYSHCGIIFTKNGKQMVYEAVQPVSITPLEQWIARGDKKHYVIKRLKNESLDKAVLEKMQTEAGKFVGRNYDLFFGWSDELIYCSELVWKVYKNAAGKELAKPKPLKDYDLNHPLVKAILQERYGNDLPLEEKMVSPGDLFNSPVLQTVVAQ